MRRKSITSLFRTGHSKQSTDRKILSEEELRFLQEKNKLEEEQIVEKHESFLEEHPNGLIDKKSFDCLLSECFTKSSRKRIRSHLWRIYDLNLDGVVDFNEFIQVLSVMSNGTPQQNLKQIFRFFDVNLNGFIEKMEMEKVVRDLLEFDCNNPHASEIAERAFQEMTDTDSERISEEQFTAACLANKKNSTLIAIKVISLFLDQ